MKNNVILLVNMLITQTKEKKLKSIGNHYTNINLFLSKPILNNLNQVQPKFSGVAYKEGLTLITLNGRSTQLLGNIATLSRPTELSTSARKLLLDSGIKVKKGKKTTRAFNSVLHSLNLVSNNCSVLLKSIKKPLRKLFSLTPKLSINNKLIISSKISFASVKKKKIRNIKRRLRKRTVKNYTTIPF